MLSTLDDNKLLQSSIIRHAVFEQNKTLIITQGRDEDFLSSINYQKDVVVAQQQKTTETETNIIPSIQDFDATTKKFKKIYV